MISRFFNSTKTFVSPIRNCYLLAALFFMIWMVFFDANNVGRQLKYANQLENLEYDHENLELDILASKEQLKELRLNKEKYAREQYYMKKDDEDVFVIDIKK